MTSVLSNLNWSVGGGGGGGVQDNNPLTKSRIYNVPSSALYYPSSGGSLLAQCPFLPNGGRARHSITPVFSSTLDPADSEEDENRNEESPQNEPEGGNNMFREDLERMVGTDDSGFSGIDLATLIRKKYGRSYDVQLIKKEFMGKNLLALNVMWKYREQRSFPLTEEEYLLRLDDVANTLKCWGAVSHIRNSLAKLKDRPRIGKGGKHVSNLVEVEDLLGFIHNAPDQMIERRSGECPHEVSTVRELGSFDVVLGLIKWFVYFITYMQGINHPILIETVSNDMVMQAKQ